MSESSSSYYCLIHCTVHHKPCQVEAGRLEARKSSPRKEPLAQPYAPNTSTEIFSAFPLFSPSCGGMTTNPCCLDVLLSDVFKRQSCHREMKLHVGCQPNAVLPTELSSAPWEELVAKIEHTLVELGNIR